MMPTPEPPQPVARPRRRKPPDEPPTNWQAQALDNIVPMPDPHRAVIEAIEEVRILARRANLPPILFGWQEEPDADQRARDPELHRHVERLMRKMTDIELMGHGPQPMPLDLIAAPEHPDAFLVEGFIRPGTTVMLAGPPGAAKSWASRQLALTAGAGLRTFLGRYDLPRRLRVLVVDEDNGPDEEWRRDQVLLSHLGLHRQDLNTVHRISLAGVQLDQEKWQGWLRGLVEQLELDVIILDPISEMHGGKELREDPEFRSLLRFLKVLKVDFPQLATVIVHHTRKPSSGDRSKDRSLDDVRGQWGQTPDVVAIMWPLGERRSSWELHKRVPHSKLILEQSETGGLVMVADDSTSRDRRMGADDQVLAAIEDGLHTADDIRIGTGLSKSGTYKALERLGMAGLITKRAPYQLVNDPTDDAL